MSCNDCLLFRDPDCLEWDQEVPVDHRPAGCEAILRDNDPAAFEKAMGRMQTSRDLWLLTFRWNAGTVTDDLWNRFLEREQELVKAAGKPIAFYFRLEKVYRWCLEKLPRHQKGSVKIQVEDVASFCGITPEQAEECLAHFFREGTLKMEKTRKKESLFWFEEVG